MSKFVIDKNKRKIIESIYEWETSNGKCYSIRFTNSDETVWCDNISDIYIAIEKNIQKSKEEANNDY